MNRSNTMLAPGFGAAILLSACDHSDRQTDAGAARSRAEAGGDPARADMPPSRPTGTVAPEEGTGVRGSENATLAMSGTASSHLVDGAGSAVYMLAGNTDGSKCDAACEEAVRPVLAHDVQPTAGTGVEGARIGNPRTRRSHPCHLPGAAAVSLCGRCGCAADGGAVSKNQVGKRVAGRPGRAAQADPR